MGYLYYLAIFKVAFRQLLQKQVMDKNHEDRILPLDTLGEITHVDKHIHDQKEIGL